MAGSTEEFSSLVPSNLSVEELQSKLDFWIHHGRNATGDNREWIRGITGYLQNRIADVRRVERSEAERLFREARRPTNHSRIRNLFG